MAVPAIKPKTKLDVSVDKPTPYTFDLSLLLANDPNPISTSTSAPAPAPAEPSTASAPAGSNPALEARLAATARDAAQALINQLLTTCPLASTPSGVLLTLPGAGATALPREKPVPEARAPTRWEQFAARKGIKPKTREQRRMKGRQYDEDAGRWERTWGWDKGGAMRRRQEGAVQRDWLVEVDEDKEREDKLRKEKESRKKRRKA